MADDRKACCQEEAGNLGESQKTTNKAITFRVCSVCKCRHFELVAEPGIVGLTGRGL